MKIPYPHQMAAIQSPFDYFANKLGYAPLIVAPVSAGKSLIHAEIIKKIHAQSPRTKILSITHSMELLEQNAEELRGQYPTADYGFYCSSLGQKRLHNDITFASIQSIGKKAHLFLRAVQVILIDEAHLCSHDESTLYRKFINDCLAINPNLVVIGMTGSPFRTDSGRLDEGENRLFDGICYEIEMSWMIEQGYWCKPYTPKVSLKMDTTGVKVRGGDFVAGELEKAVDVDEITQACVDDMIAQAYTLGRKKWLIFTAGVKHCEHVRDALRARGISAEMVTGETPKDERRRILAAHKKGEFTALVNVATLTTGYNDPTIDLLVFMRPLKSPVLYIQITGRGVRTWYASGYDLSTQQGRLDAIANSPKPNIPILDYGGVIDELGPIDMLDIRKSYKKKEPSDIDRKPIFKRCPSCNIECAPAQKYCYECGYNFASAALNQKSSEAAVVSADMAPIEYAVVAVEYDCHKKKGAGEDHPMSLFVNYITLSGHYAEYVCFEHHKYEVGDPKRFAWDKAVKWFKQRLPNDKVPTSVNDSMFFVYPQPSHVTVKRDGKYWRVLSVRFDKQTEEERPDIKLSKELEEWDTYMREQGMNPDEIPF